MGYLAKLVGSGQRLIYGDLGAMLGEDDSHTDAGSKSLTKLKSGHFFFHSVPFLLQAGLYSHCVMDYAPTGIWGEDRVGEEGALIHYHVMAGLKHCACLHQCSGRGLFMD